MSARRTYVAVDLGAESGRVVAGQFDGERIALAECHRFANGPVRLMDSLHWDAPGLFREITAGLGLCVKQRGPDLAAIGVDSWGVDFGLLAADGELLGNPYHYRDARTNGMLEEAFGRVPREQIYEATGIQFMQLNTLYQLLSMALAHSPLLEVAGNLLLMGDLYNHFLCGSTVAEFSNATTTAFYNPRKGGWAADLLDGLGIPTQFLPEVVPPGTKLDPLLPWLAEELGCGPVPVIAPATHDTGSAVAAVPAHGDDWAYLSSGTWSLMGVELPGPLINAQALAYEFTNEGGVCGTIRFLKNIMGLWLVQECRRTWEREQDRAISYAELTEQAQAVPGLVSLVHPDHASFLAPGDMPARLRRFCERTGQAVPESAGALVRCCLDSLALRYRWVVERLEGITGRSIRVVHIVGGGSRNTLLNQLAADAMGRTVVAGPVEATALGNCLMQGLALGDIGSLEEGREVVRRSFDVVTYEPQQTDRWAEAYARYLALLEAARSTPAS